MKTSNFSKRFNLSVYRQCAGSYNAHRAFIRLKNNSVNYRILDVIFNNNKTLSRREINERVGMPADVKHIGYRSYTFARMIQDGLIIYDRKNNCYEITDLGINFLRYADN